MHYKNVCQKYLEKQPSDDTYVHSYVRTICTYISAIHIYVYNNFGARMHFTKNGGIK